MTDNVNQPAAALKKNGRPSIYTDEVANRIVSELADGRSLVQICQAADMPGRRTVLDWQEKDDVFRTRCARARAEGADLAFDKMAGIEADVLAGKMDAQAARVVLSSMQWRLSKLAPRRFGDKLELSADPERPLVQKEMSPLESARAIAFAMALAQHADMAGEKLIEANVESNLERGV